jgi:DNA-binding transcriptional LysR family regulator
MPGLNLKFVRGSSADVVEQLKKGGVDVAVASKLPETWDRLESWPLFTRAYRLVVSKDHRFAGKGSVSTEELRKERLICRPYCEDFERGIAFLTEAGVEVPSAHNAGSDVDFAALLAADLGVGFAPQSTSTSPQLTLVGVEGFEMERTIFAYAVAGRQRSMAASTLIKMMRAADWSQREGESKAA